MPSEVLSLEVRSAGYSMVTFLNFIMTFVVGQSFLSMLCAFRVSRCCPPYTTSQCLEACVLELCQLGLHVYNLHWD